jgi:hypothetical protein
MRSALFCFALLAGAGCGSSQPTVNNSQDPEAYARDVKQLVYDVVESAPQSREPADQIALVVTELEQTDRPRGNYANTYTQLLTTAKEIQAECEKSGGKPSNLPTRLAQLKKIAQALPGDVKANKAEKKPADD